MKCCSIPGLDAKLKDGAKTVILVGNPNVGKSVFFNALTGMYVDVSNFPGTTVDISHGKFGEYIVVDTPGVYGVSSFNDEERVARDVILFGDMVLNIVDALHLERDLFLTQQIIDMGKPVVVALNMMDEAVKNGIDIDVELLKRRLGVPVIPTVAVRGEGIDRVKKAIRDPLKGKRIPLVEELLKGYENIIENEAEALMVLEDDENVAKRYDIETAGKREEIYRERRKWVNDIVDAVVSETDEGASFRTRLGRWMVRPVSGIPMLIFTLWLLYQIVGVFVAQWVVGITEETIMSGLYQPFIENAVSTVVKPGTFLGELLVGEFGLMTMVPVYILGLLLPLVIGFYFFLSVIEDSGYLPRIATLMDRVLTAFGLNGRAVIPMILGFGCVTMATITTRILGSKRERFIATMLLGLAIPCSAQLGVIAGMMAALGAKYMLVYGVTIFLVFIIIGTLLNKVMPGESTVLLIDLPPLRLPILKNVLMKTKNKAVMFLKEATPLFFLGAALISIMQYTGMLEGIQTLFSPVTVGLLKLPAEAATAFIMGIIRRDFGAAGLYALTMSPVQTLVSLVTITLFVPCIAAVMIVFKERSWLEAAVIWIGSFVISFLTGGLLAWVI
ncbi:MAG: ferrous iron transport protein B [Bacillota bacterium]|nr:ferrous iron transport protein B [Bacillota bacterium]